MLPTRIGRNTAQFILALSCILVISCTGNSGSSTTDTNTSSCKKLNPEKAAEKIISVYHLALSETVDMLKNNPNGSEIERAFNNRLEEYQNLLLTIGQQVAAMSPQDKTKVQSLVNLGFSKYQYDPQLKKLFDEFSASIFAYSKTDKELYKKMKSINIITQFAFFDLLKKQNPGAVQQWGKMMVAKVCQ